MFPTLSEAVTGDAPHGRGAVLQQVDGADRPDPAVPDRRRPAARVAQVDADATCAIQFLWPVAAGVVTAGALAALGMRVWASGLCFALCAFVVGTIVQEFWRGANVRRRNTGTDLFTALVGLVGRNKRRYGGYIVHLGIVLIFLGFAGNGFKQDEQVLLKPGEQVDGRQLHAPQRRRRRCSDDGQKQMIDGVHRGVRGRQADRHAVSGEVGLPQARERADDRSGDPPHVRRGPVRRAGVQPSDLGDADRDACRSSSTRWSTGSGSGSASWRSAPASRCCRSAPTRSRWRSCRSKRRRRRRDAAARGAALRRHAAVGAAGHGRAGRSEHPVVVLRAQRVREEAAARDRLHLRRLRPRDDRRVPQGSVHDVARDARRAGDAASIRARTTTRSSRRSSPSTAARRCSARRSTRASTGSPGCSRTWSAPPAPSRRLRRGALVAQARRRRPRPPPPSIPALEERLDDELRNLD